MEFPSVGTGQKVEGLGYLLFTAFRSSRTATIELSSQAIIVGYSVLASVVRMLSAMMLSGEANISVAKASGLAVDSSLGFDFLGFRV